MQEIPQNRSMPLIFDLGGAPDRRENHDNSPGKQRLMFAPFPATIIFDRAAAMNARWNSKSGDQVLVAPVIENDGNF
jgi:hypothetical protein